MSRIAYIDGVYQPLNEPGIFVEDRGYQFADGVYEVCAVRDRMMLDEAAHLDRLERSLSTYSYAVPLGQRHVVDGAVLERYGFINRSLEAHEGRHLRERFHQTRRVLRRESDQGL